MNCTQKCIRTLNKSMSLNIQNSIKNCITIKKIEFVRYTVPITFNHK